MCARCDVHASRPSRIWPCVLKACQENSCKLTGEKCVRWGSPKQECKTTPATFCSPIEIQSVHVCEFPHGHARRDPAPLSDWLLYGNRRSALGGGHRQHENSGLRSQWTA